MNIRQASAIDATPLAEIYNHYVTHTAVTFDVVPVTTENRLEWINRSNLNPFHRLFIGEIDGVVIGYASSSQFRVKPAYDRSVETTIYLAPDAQGSGLGRRLYGHLLDELAATQVHRCYGVIALPNDASVALHQRLGFSDVGHLTEVGYKFDQYWDTVWMEKVMS